MLIKLRIPNPNPKVKSTKIFTTEDVAMKLGSENVHSLTHLFTPLKMDFFYLHGPLSKLTAGQREK